MFPNFFKDGKLPGEDFINSMYPILIALGVGIFFGFRSYFKGTQCPCQINMNGKTVIITGANCGIGFELARVLSSAGGRVILACRNVQKANEAIKQINELKSGDEKLDLIYIPLDLASFQSIKKFVQLFKKDNKKLDLLINNAGIMCQPFSLTVDGFESHFQVNYLGHFLLTYLLLDILKMNEGSRVLNITAHAYKLATDFNPADLVKQYSNQLYKNTKLSENKDIKNSLLSEERNKIMQLNETNEFVTQHDILTNSENNFEVGKAYAESKLAVALFSSYLASVLGTSSSSYLINPGVAKTNLYHKMSFVKNPIVSFALAPFLWFFMKTSYDAAQTILYCSSSELKNSSGKYYRECKESISESIALDEVKAKELWQVSLKLCQLEAMD